MTLVERLRWLSETHGIGSPDVFEEAADRIEALEAALETADAALEIYSAMIKEAGRE